MKKILIPTIFFFPLLFIACTKDEGFGHKTYYGKVTFELVNFPNTPGISISLNEEAVNEWRGIKFNVEAGFQNHISVFKAGTNELIADTLLTLNRNENNTLKIAYSEELGIKGFVDMPPVPAGFNMHRFKHNLTQSLFPFPNIDLYIFRSTDTTASGVVKMVGNLQYGAGYSPAVVPLPVKDENGKNLIYYFKMKDRATGQYIHQPFLNRDFTGIGTTTVSGLYYFNEITDNGVDRFVLKRVSL